MSELSLEDDFTGRLLPDPEDDLEQNPQAQESG